MVYLFLHRYGRTTSIYRRKIGFTVGSVSTDGQGYLVRRYVVLSRRHERKIYFTDGKQSFPSVCLRQLVLDMYEKFDAGFVEFTLFGI